MKPLPASCELTVVIPVYNEEGAIENVVRSWDQELSRLGIDYQIQVYDDASKDRSWTLLQSLEAALPRLSVQRNPVNQGHGPTILNGYRHSTGTWTFQVDGDDEIPASCFDSLWAARTNNDFVLGWRTHRAQPLGRRLISWAARLTVRLFFGPVRDVNIPYRLMRTVPLRDLLKEIPSDTFAPNVILSGLAIKRKLRIDQKPVFYQKRRTGQVSIMKWKLWRSASRSLFQTLAVAFRS